MVECDCPNCHRHLTFNAAKVGMVKCLECSSVFQLPGDARRTTPTTQKEQAQKTNSWAEATGAGLFGGAIAGVLAGHGGGKLGFGGFIVFLLFVSQIKPGSRKALAVIVFVLVASLCAVLFKK